MEPVHRLKLRDGAKKQHMKAGHNKEKHKSSEVIAQNSSEQPPSLSFPHLGGTASAEPAALSSQRPAV